MKTVVAGALGECVHVAGIMNFLRLAKIAGWQTVFLGPAVPIEQVLAAARREKVELRVTSTSSGRRARGFSVIHWTRTRPAPTWRPVSTCR